MGANKMRDRKPADENAAATYIIDFSDHDTCIRCGNYCRVNRISADDSRRMPVAPGSDDPYIEIEIVGWMCEECQQFECASCGELSLNYEMIDGGVYCETCAEKKISS